MYYYHYSSGYSTTALALRAKSSLYHSLNGGDPYSHYSQSSLYSLHRNPSRLLHGYLLSRSHSTYVPLEPSRTFLLTARRIGTVRIRHDGGSAEASRCCCCCACSKGENPGLDLKKPLRKEDSCNSNSGFSKKSLRKEEAFVEVTNNLPRKSSFLNDFERSNSQRRRRRNVFAGESSRGKFDGVDLEEKEVREVRKYEDGAPFGKDSRKETDSKGFDSRYTEIRNESNLRNPMSSERTESRKSSKLASNIERVTDSQRRLEQVKMNAREDNRTEVDRQNSDYMESNRRYKTQTDLSDTRRASGTRTSLEIRDQRHFEEEQMKGRETRYASTENLVHVAGENRTEIDRQEFDKMESNRHNETRSDFSRIHASDARRANDTNSSLEIKDGGRWSDINRRYFREEQMKERENRSTSVENVVQAASENRTQIDQQEFDKTESNCHNETQSDISRIHARRTRITDDTNSSLENRWSDINRRYFGEEQLKKRENKSNSVENVVHMARDKRTQMEVGSSSRIHASETERASSSRASLEMRIDSKGDVNLHEIETSHTEKISNLQEVSDTRIENRKETSSSHLLRENEKQRSTLSGERLQSTETQRSSSGYQEKSDAIESAHRLGKSSSFYVGEFVDKLRQEISTTEISETNTERAQMGTSGSVSNVTARFEEERYTKDGDRHSSSRTGIKGPSDEMWEVRGHSSQEPSKVEEPEKDSSQEPSKVEEPEKDSSPLEAVNTTPAPGSDESAVSRRSHRSLWTYLASILKLGWNQRARSHNSATKSRARSSSNESIGSDAWFSGNEPDENEDETKKKSRNGSPKEPFLTRTPAEQHQVGSSPSVETSRISSSSMTEIGKRVEEFSRERLHVVSGTEASETERIRSQKGKESRKDPVDQSHLGSSVSLATTEMASSFKDSSVVSRPEYLEQIEGKKGSQDSVSDVVTVEQPPSSSPLTTEVENVHMPESESATNRGKLPEVGGSEAKDSELKRRKFQRNKQVLREQFDDWEEAYIREREQRKTDELFMREALLEAKKAAGAWEVPVGAVLVHNGKIISRGCNLVEELRDSTAHAEMICIREASNLLRTWRLAETTLYVTLEPCAMCAGAILQARIDTVVWGAPNKLLGADGSWVRLFPTADGGGSTALDSSNQIPGPVHPFHPKITVRRGILATECADAMQQFFQLRRKKNTKEEQSSPPSCLPVSANPSKLFTKMHDLFCIMFCL